MTGKTEDKLFRADGCCRGSNICWAQGESMLEDAKQVRAAARKKLLISSWILFVVPVVVYLTEIVTEIQLLKRLLVVCGAFLCTPFLMSLLELIAGVPFTELSNRWDGLKGWQRGVIGFIGCGFLITLIILLMGSILPLFIK